METYQDLTRFPRPKKEATEFHPRALTVVAASVNPSASAYKIEETFFVEVWTNIVRLLESFLRKIPWPVSSFAISGL